MKRWTLIRRVIARRLSALTTATRTEVVEAEADRLARDIDDALDRAEGDRPLRCPSCYSAVRSWRQRDDSCADPWHDEASEVEVLRAALRHISAHGGAWSQRIAREALGQ